MATYNYKGVQMISNTVCFIGHRNQKLPWKDKIDLRYALTRIAVQKEIEICISNGKTHFISGMTLGFDIMCSRIVLDLKEKYPFITLECALPYYDQDKYWSLGDKIIYKNILERADKVRCIYDHYTRGCMRERNRYMVNSSSMVIALFDNIAGGTEKTIAYAKKQGKYVVIIPPSQERVYTSKVLELLLADYIDSEPDISEEKTMARKRLLSSLYMQVDNDEN